MEIFDVTPDAALASDVAPNRRECIVHGQAADVQQDFCTFRGSGLTYERAEVSLRVWTRQTHCSRM